MKTAVGNTSEQTSLPIIFLILIITAPCLTKTHLLLRSINGISTRDLMKTEKGEIQRGQNIEKCDKRFNEDRRKEKNKKEGEIQGEIQ